MKRLILPFALLGTIMTPFFVSGSVACASEPREVGQSRVRSRSDAEILDALFKTVPEDNLAVRQMFRDFSDAFTDVSDFKQTLIQVTAEHGVKQATNLLKRYYNLIWNYEEDKNSGIICMFNKTYHYHEAILSKALEIIKASPDRSKSYLEEAQKLYSKCQNIFPQSVRLKFKRELGLMSKEEVEKQDQKWATLLVVDGKVRFRSKNEELLKAAIAVANADQSVHSFEASEEIMDDNSVIILLDGLQGNMRIKTIDLHYNFISNKSLDRIRTFVKDHTNLQEMDLTNNFLDWEYVQPIYAILEERTKSKTKVARTE